MVRSQKMFWIIILALGFYFLSFTGEPIGAATKKTSKPKSSQATQSTNKEKPAQKAEAQPPTQGGLQYDAKSALLMDGLTGEILYEQNPDMRIPPASFVKVMTLYVIFEAVGAGQLKMDDMVTVSEKAWRTQGSKMFVKVGERVRVDDLIKGIAIVSGNDACIALAEHVAGSEEVFVSKMNEKAKLLGMKNSQFGNSHGMPAENQYTTALDMAVLSRRYVEAFPDTLAIHSTTEFEYNGIRQGNRNTLLQKNIGVDGLKTGHIEESGYHLAATAKRGDQRMIAVIMGCDKMKKRGPETQRLLEYGFKNFTTVEAVKKEAPYSPIKVKWGKSDQVIPVASVGGRVTVPRGKESLVSVLPQLPQAVVAPVQKGQVLGKLLLQKEGKTVREIDLVASQEVRKSLIPPWPYLVAGLLGIILIGLIGFWFLRRPSRR